jgi:hypothetical protein
MPRGTPTTVDEALLRIKDIDRRRDAAKQLWEMKRKDQSAWNSWLAGQTPERRRGAELYADGYQKFLSEKGLLGRAVRAVRDFGEQIGEAGADVLEDVERIALVPGARAAKRSVRAYEQRSGTNLPGVGLSREEIDATTPAERLALQDEYGAHVVNMATLGVVPASKMLEARERAGEEVARDPSAYYRAPQRAGGMVPDIYAAGLPRAELTEAQRAGAAVEGELAGMATWLGGPGRAIHAGGRAVGKALPRLGRVGVRLGEGAVLGAGHATGELIEGKSLKHAALTGAEVTAAWAVFAPVIEAFLGTLAAPFRDAAKKRTEAHFGKYLRGLKEPPSEVELAGLGGALDRIVEQEAARLPKAAFREPPSVRPQFFNERAAARDVRQRAETRAAFDIDTIEPRPLIGEKKLLLPEISEWEQFAEGFVRTKDEMAIIGSRARPRPKPEPTMRDTMAAEADARAETVVRARERGIGKAEELELEKAVSEADVPPKPASPAQDAPPAAAAAPGAAARAEAAQVPPIQLGIMDGLVDVKGPSGRTSRAVQRQELFDRILKQEETGAVWDEHVVSVIDATKGDIGTELAGLNAGFIQAEMNPIVDSLMAGRIASEKELSALLSDAAARARRSIRGRLLPPDEAEMVRGELAAAGKSPEEIETFLAGQTYDTSVPRAKAAPKAPPEPTGTQMFVEATGVKPTPPPGTGMTRTGGGRKRGAALLEAPGAEEVSRVLRHAWGTANEAGSSQGTIMRSTGPSGQGAMGIVDLARFYMDRYKGKSAELIMDAVKLLERPLKPTFKPFAPLGRSPESLRRVLSALEGKTSPRSLVRPGERQAYKELRAVLDEFGIAPMEDGVTTIRALDDIVLADGTVIPKTGEGAEVWSNLRLAKGEVTSVSQLKRMPEVPIQLADPLTGEVLPEIHMIAQSRLRLPVREAYLPIEFDPKFLRGGKLQSQLEQALVRAGKAGDTDAARLIIRNYQGARVDPWHTSYRLSRTDIDGLHERFYLPAEERLANYIDGATRHLAWGRTAGAGTSLKKEGWKFEELVDLATVGVPAERVPAEGIEEFINRGWAADLVEAQMMLGRMRSHFLDAVRADMGMAVKDEARGILGPQLRLLRSATAAGSLQRVFWTNLSQPGNIAALAGWRNLGSAMIQSMNGLTRKEMRELGVTQTHGLEAALGISGDVWHQKLARWMVTKGYALGPMENWLRTVAAIASRKHAADSFARLQANPGDAWATEALRILRIDGAAAVKRGHLLEAELMEAAYWGAAETQYLTRMTDMPVWYSTEGGKTLAQFLGFVYQQGKLMQKLVLRDLKDPVKAAKLFGTIFVGMPLFGEFAMGTKSLIGLRPRTSSEKARYVEDFFNGGGVHIALEMFWDAAYASDHGDMFAGAALGQLGEAFGAASELSGWTGLRESLDAVPRTPGQEAADKLRAKKFFLKKLPVPHGLARTGVELAMPPKSLADVPMWLRAEDVGQSIFHPRSEATNIWELRAKWKRMSEEMKDAHWAALSPGDKVNHFIKLEPEHRAKWMEHLGPVGQKRFARDVKRLGDKAKERVRWGVADLRQHRAEKAREKAEREEAAVQP